MTIANNGGRSKLIKIQKFQKVKCGTVSFSTSNKPLSELTGRYEEGAIDSRIFEFDVQDPELNIFGINDQGEDVVEWWQEEINDNFGHLYPMIIDYIVKHVMTQEKYLCL
jgi:hypothetical protein